MESLLAQHRADIEKAIEHGAQRERQHGKGRMSTLTAEAEQARLELAEERS